MARAAQLIGSIDEVRAALQVTLAETKRLLALTRTISHAQPCSPRLPCTAA
jgi:hypothetical protein